MPPVAPKPCGHPGCPRLSVDGSGYCDRHQDDAKRKRADAYRRQDRRRGTATSRGYDADWRRARDRAMQDAGGLCVMCSKAGRYVRATVVHHVQTVEDRPDLRLEPGNLMPLCRDCHEREHGRKR